MSIYQILDNKKTKKPEHEVLEIFDIMNTECQLEQNGVCKKLALIMNIIDDRYVDDRYSEEELKNQVLIPVDNQFVKNFYEDEFWKHAPENIKILKTKIKNDPDNFYLLDRYSMLLKIYTHQIKYTWNIIPEDPIKRKKEIRTIIRYMTKKVNYNIDE